MIEDICSNRHKGSPTSKAANLRVDKDRDRERVLAIIRRDGRTYSKAIAREMDKALNQISGRLSELKAANVITETKERREGCAVVAMMPGQMRLF